ncbi:Hypothetical protein IALB_1374 [Ignavibacterium album JCM 16511]|uniref:DUF5683 domain-containing protein n=1 Tax=Ignavibacterium album (strain DSM 19864 / JCM 16511 / NBRC 101810 / Mat9-16) TaxID=945713 RepID=I0AJC7_IGNAJ|nr:hypothetical protein [Ignavibacterium album]AFH49084.1 Hypothetical protein IALB_1374 [Ignavibacterium album JCM 16511]
MNKLFVFLFLISVNFSFAQEKIQANVTGNLASDAKTILAEYKSVEAAPLNLQQSSDRKSPILAGLFSVLVPGSGELYTGEYLKAAIFGVLEAGLITAAIVYNNKGDSKTDEFQNYADNVTDNSGWSVVRYAQWINQYKDKNIQINPDPNLKPWQRVSWEELNSVEREIQGFSHTLAQHGEQQYYEMIGKYHQFSPGWWDFNGGSNNSDISPAFKYYSGLRGDANDFYNMSTAAVIGIYINHFLSGLDAVWSAVQFNKDLAVKVRMDSYQLTNKTELFPAVYLKYNL